VVLRRLLLLPGGGAARAASVPTASGTFEIRLYEICVVSLETLICLSDRLERKMRPRFE